LSRSTPQFHGATSCCRRLLRYTHSKPLLTSMRSSIHMTKYRARKCPSFEHTLRDKAWDAKLFHGRLRAGLLRRALRRGFACCYACGTPSVAIALRLMECSPTVFSRYGGMESLARKRVSQRGGHLTRAIGQLAKVQLCAHFMCEVLDY